MRPGSVPEPCSIISHNWKLFWLWQGWVSPDCDSVHCRVISTAVPSSVQNCRYDVAPGCGAVTDDALTQCIGDLRKALGDDSRNPRYLKTVPKQGYQFIGDAIVPAAGEVEIETTTALEVEVTETLPAPAALPAPGGRRWPYALAAIAVVSAAALWLLVAGNRVNPTLPEMAGKTPVAVMFFENRSGNRDLDWLREGVPDMLITNLSRSPKLALMAREHLALLLDRAGQDRATKVGLQQALDLARHSHARIVILGAFTSLAGALRLDAQIYDARDGRLLAGESLTVEHPEDLLTRFDTLPARIALHLGAPIPGLGVSGELAEARTNNVEAFRAYSVGIERAQQFHMVEALDLFRKAAELDRKFVMAQARIGYTYAVTSGKIDEGRPYLAKAFEQSQALPGRDRLYIAAWYALACKDYEAAVKAYRQIVADYPAEVPAYVSLGRVLRGERRHKEALDVLQLSLALDSDYADAHNALSGIYFELESARRL
jgi:tetratricopeptide (TPR) repeat protein